MSCVLWYSSSDDKFRSVSRLSVVNQVFIFNFASTVDLMLDLPRYSSSVTQVLLWTVRTTFKTLLIFCILSHIIPKSFYVSVYEFYLAIRKTVSLQCISRRRLTSCLISWNSSPLLVFVISPLGKTFQNKNLQNLMSYCHAYDTWNCTVIW